MNVSIDAVRCLFSQVSADAEMSMLMQHRDRPPIADIEKQRIVKACRRNSGV